MDEKRWVETMFTLYSIWWMLVTSVHFLLASDPSLTGRWSVNILDFLIGAISGVYCVQLVEYLRGFIFIDSQDESDFIYVAALGLKIVGVINWSFVCYMVMLILRDWGLQREH